jgi:hypothetical protein
MDELNQKRTSYIDRWNEGSITFVEMVEFLATTITEEEMKEHQE